MTVPKIEHSPWDDLESQAFPKYREGVECPVYTLDLFNLATNVVNGAEPREEERQLQAHLRLCEACRSVFDSAMWFLQSGTTTSPPLLPERPAPGGVKKCVGALLANPDAADVEALLRARKEVPEAVATLGDYVKKLIEHANIAFEDAVKILGLAEHGGLESLNRISESTERVIRLLGIDTRFAKLALKCGCLNLQDSLVTAPRQSVPNGAAVQESACDVFHRLLKEVDDNIGSAHETELEAIDKLLDS